jgi:hypothetical protein
MKVKIKRGAVVVIDGGTEDSPILNIIMAARDTAPTFSDDTLWITSGIDGHHGLNSLHYRNQALDLRIRNIVGDRTHEAQAWAARMRLKLGDDYDVVVETHHIHVEYDP